MKTSYKKYLLALIPLMLFLAAVSFRPVASKADTCWNDQDQPVDCATTGGATTASGDAPGTAGANAGLGGSVNGSNSNSGNASNGASSGLSGTAGSPAGNSGLSGNTSSTGHSGLGANTSPSTGGTFYLQNPLSSQFTTVGGIVGGFIQIFVYLAVLFAVVMIIYVGLRLVLAQGDPTEITKRKEQLLYLVIGLAIIIGARIIVQVVINTLQATGTVNPAVITGAKNALSSQ